MQMQEKVQTKNEERARRFASTGEKSQRLIDLVHQLGTIPNADDWNTIATELDKEFIGDEPVHPLDQWGEACAKAIHDVEHAHFEVRGAVAIQAARDLLDLAHRLAGGGTVMGKYTCDCGEHDWHISDRGVPRQEGPPAKGVPCVDGCVGHGCVKESER